MNEGDEFCYQRGIVEYVEHLNRTSDPLHRDVIFFSGEIEGVGYEVAMQYTTEYTETDAALGTPKALNTVAQGRAAHPGLPVPRHRQP